LLIGGKRYSKKDAFGRGATHQWGIMNNRSVLDHMNIGILGCASPPPHPAARLWMSLLGCCRLPFSNFTAFNRRKDANQLKLDGMEDDIGRDVKRGYSSLPHRKYVHFQSCQFQN
jgi:hypothetical protein